MLCVRMLHEVMDHDLEAQIGRKQGQLCDAEAIRGTGTSRALQEPGEPETSENFPLCDSSSQPAS